MTIVAGTSNSKSKREQKIDPMTSSDLNEMQIDTDASDNSMIKIMWQIRKKLGKKAIEPNANKGLLEKGKTLDSFYSKVKLPMEVKRAGVKAEEAKGAKEEQRVEVEEGGAGQEGGQGKGGGKGGKGGGKRGKKEKGSKEEKPAKVTVTEEKDVVCVHDVSDFVQVNICSLFA